MNNDQIQEIKSLAAGLEDHAVLFYSKKAFLLMLEFAGWLIFTILLVLAIYLLFFVPYTTIQLSENEYVTVKLHSQELKKVFYLMSGFLLIFDLPVLLITLFIRRFRKKKASVYELINKIKSI